MSQENIENPLGKTVKYIDQYSPNLLFPIARNIKRKEINIQENLPFYGYDIWNAYEVSWLNNKGKPEVALAKIIFNCESEYLIESKSLKLYLNSFNNSKFVDIFSVKDIIIKDLSNASKSKVEVNIFTIDYLDSDYHQIQNFNAINIDNLDIDCHNITNINNNILTTSAKIVEENLYTNLLKSNCLVTGQPDWASLFIHYKGQQINHENLLKYIVSFRNHNEFHEQCVERIFLDISNTCRPELLTIYARYTRRGGIDINPYRSSKPIKINALSNIRLVRQ